MEKPLHIVRGSDALTLPTQQRAAIAQEISSRLAEHPQRMRQLLPQTIQQSMEAGRFALLLGAEQQLVACTQVWPLPNEESVMECGTWLNLQPPGYPRGMGARAMVEGARLAQTFPQTEQVVALVEERNITAQTALKRLGGEHISTRTSDYVRSEGDTPAIMHVFDISSIGE